MFKFSAVFTVIVILLISSMTHAQTAPAGNTIDQARVDAAMQRLRQRQAERQRAATQPAAPTTGSSDTVWSPPYVDKEVETFRRRIIADLIYQAQSYSKMKDQKAVDHLIAERRAVVAVPIGDIRDLMVKRDNFNKLEIDRMLPRYEHPLSVAKAACRWLEKTGAVRSASVATNTDSANDGSTFPVAVDFEFVTKGGLIRQNRGYIRFERRSLPFSVPVAAGIDSVQKGDLYPGVNDHPFDNVDLFEFNKQFGGTFKSYQIVPNESGLVLIDPDCAPDAR